MQRPSVRLIFADAVAHKFSKLLVYKLDRWARNTRDFYNTYDHLAKLGITLVVPDQVPDVDTPSGKAFMGFLAVFAELEGSMIRQRAIDTTTDLKGKGRVLGRSPYGYKPGLGLHSVVPDEEKLRTVRRVYDLFESALFVFGVSIAMTRVLVVIRPRSPSPLDRTTAIFQTCAGTVTCPLSIVV